MSSRIGISVWFIEAFTVWIPCYQVFRHQTLQQETLDAIALWEARTKSGTTTCSGTTHVPRSVADTYKTLDSVEAAKEKNGDGFEKSSIESIYTISALEHTLNQNPEPLRKFAALRDFSGENIAFLIGVREWKSMWPESGSPPDKFDQFEGPSRRQLFKRAVHVYANYVSPLYAEFPINISSRDLRNLDALFLEAARVLYGDSRRSSLSDATPFSDSSGKSMYGESEGQAARRSMRGEDSETNLVDLIAEKVQYWGEIPKEFSKTAFDDAEMSIKYLVLTNTWPKFLKERREKQSAQSSSESSTSSRVTKYFKGLISASIRSKASL